MKTLKGEGKVQQLCLKFLEVLGSTLNPTAAHKDAVIHNP